MEITKITLTNIRCFEEFEVDLRTENGSKQWLVILGDNGVGKTTILKSVALGLCEESGASGLLAESGAMIRYNAPKGIIRIDIKPHRNYKETAYIETTLTRNDDGEIKLTQINYPKKPTDFKWEDLFASGYGVGRGIFGTEDVFEYAVTDSVYSLFNSKSNLQNPELNLRRIKDEMGEAGKEGILRKIENILLLPEKSIELGTRTGITIKDFWGVPMQYGAMGDGYASTLTWIMDLYGWKLQYDRHMRDLEVNGIVIIDELENHLHPSWQKKIIGLLSQQFPLVQFIVSTHSPLCVVGTTDLEDKDCSITVLREGEKTIEYEIAKPPRGKRVDQILTSYLFELYSASDNKIREDIERYNYLYKKRRSKEEEEEMHNLFSHLNLTLGSAETELERNVGEVLNTTLNALFKNVTKKTDEMRSPEKFELIRQLSDLLK